MAEKETVTPSTISYVIAGEYPHFSPEQAALGKQEHKRIAEQVIWSSASVLPGFREDAPPIDIPPGEIFVEKTLSYDIKDNLTLRTRPDIRVGNNACIEIKPTLRGRHMIQVLFECMCLSYVKNSDPVHGMLFCYREGNIINYQHQGKTYLLPNGGVEYWVEAIEIAVLAHEIAKTQKRIDELRENGYRNRKKPTISQFDIAVDTRFGTDRVEQKASERDWKGIEFHNLNQHAIDVRRELDPKLDRLLGNLNVLMLAN